MKRKFTSLLLALLFALPALAQQFEYHGFWYYVLDNEAKTCEVFGNGHTKGDLVIPSTVYNEGETYFVTAIGHEAFSSCSSLTSVVIPETVTVIGSWAFSYCSSLTSITIPESVTVIGSYAFRYCKSLLSVVIPTGVTIIENDTFSECSSLTSVVIPEGVNTIGKDAFGFCSALTSVVIPETVTVIENYAFADCPALTLVYYYAEKLIDAANHYVFSNKTYDNATLYLLESALPQAETVEPWCLFKHRKIGSKSGVESVAADTEAPVEVYSLGGVKVGESTEGLPAGIYVVRQGSEVRKINVK